MRRFPDRVFPYRLLLEELKAGMDKETAICESLERGSCFAAGICGMEGAFGYGKKDHLNSRRGKIMGRNGKSRALICFGTVHDHGSAGIFQQ